MIIAEAGVNHDGEVAKAHALIDVAADAGADAVKFQTFSADRLVTPEARKAAYQARNEDGESQLAMLRRLELSEDAHLELLRHAKQRGIEFMSTPFDEEAADFLVSIGVERLKSPSGELTNTPYLCHLARTGLPLIVSTGMATIAEVDVALRALRGVSGCGPLVVLHCTSAYPAPAEAVNLRAMVSMGAAFGVDYGYSDHTVGSTVGIAAVALGACVVEKHVTLDPSAPGPDHAASLAPHEFRAFVEALRVAERALGDGVKRPQDIESDVAAVARKSIVLKVGLGEGHVLRVDDLVMRRPGSGLTASWLDVVVGRRLVRSLPEGHLLSWGDLS